ncbi:replicative DNA helicase [Carnimonas bestiolae]|uniref:replicative DNA helicase n=1 Tax=Carnimonas bestiolae TaxID=3402172 RepID=UPI003F4AEADC
MASTNTPTKGINEEALGLVPPHSIEAEQSVIGGLMLDNSCWDEVHELVTPDAFYRTEHRQIFKAMESLLGGQQPVDVVTVSEKLGDDTLEKVGGLAYLAELARNTPSTSNITAYASIVRERHQLRLLANTTRDFTCRSLSGTEESETLIQQLEAQVANIADDHIQNSPEILTALSAAIDAIDTACNSADGITGTPTGYADLDRMTGGLQDGDLCVLAGRPSMGKTTLGMNIVENALASNHMRCAQSPCFVFSLEMPASQLMLRLMASIGKIDLQTLRSGDLDDQEWSQLSAATLTLKGYANKLFIDDQSGISATALKGRARRMSRRYGRPSLIMVDYLQLLSEPGCENRNTEISAISRILKHVAKELRCPVVALAQLNRGVETRPNKRPTMADLRDSGGIEQDADLIGLIYRDEVYHPDQPGNEGQAELIIGKQRNGPTGTVHLVFRPQCTRFESLEWKHGGAL